MINEDPTYKTPEHRLGGMQTIFDSVEPVIEADQSESESVPGQEPHTPGGGVSGFEEIDVVLCRNGSPVEGKILFKQT